MLPWFVLRCLAAHKSGQRRCFGWRCWSIVSPSIFRYLKWRVHPHPKNKQYGCSAHVREIPIPQQKPKKDSLIGYRTAHFYVPERFGDQESRSSSLFEKHQILPQSKTVRARLEHALILVSKFTLIMSKICAKRTSKTTAISLQSSNTPLRQSTTNILPSLKLTNKQTFSPLKKWMVGWKMFALSRLPFGSFRPIFRGKVDELRPHRLQLRFYATLDLGRGANLIPCFPNLAGEKTTSWFRVICWGWNTTQLYGDYNR